MLLGATGWIAGYVNAFPAASVRLYELCAAGDYAAAMDLYRVLLPALRWDADPRFVQAIKLAQEEAGRYGGPVRLPRLPLPADEEAEARAVARACGRRARRLEPVMRAQKVFSAVDSHTEGMPTRVITSGLGVLPGATMFDRMRYLVSERDDLRTLLMYEPRGHAAMSGAILQPPARPDADVGVVFIEVSGCLPMCGHGTIGTATVLVETGMVAVKEPVTLIRLDTPAGLVEASVAVSDGHATSVTIRNVPRTCISATRGHRPGARGADPGRGVRRELLRDPARRPRPGWRCAPTCTIASWPPGWQIMDAVNEQLTFAHPEQPGDQRVPARRVHRARGGRPARPRRGGHPPGLGGPLPLRHRDLGADGRSSRRAGELAVGEDFVHGSLIGTTFTGRLVERPRSGTSRRSCRPSAAARG